MRTKFLWMAAGLALAVSWPAPPSMAQPADPGWPRVFKKDKQQLTVYQPQVDYWHGYTNLHFRCAIAVKGVSKQGKFGVAEVDALTITDHGARIVALVPLKRELRFANVPEPELTKLRQAVEKLNPSGQVTTLSLDRVDVRFSTLDNNASFAASTVLDAKEKNLKVTVENSGYRRAGN